MLERGRPPERVGARELRQNLSAYLSRAEAGETLEVTEHGRPVARLGPAPTAETSVLDRLIAEGRATPASDPHGPWPPLIQLPDDGGPTLTEVLLQMRDEEEF
jgi:prevent-host-death family protein